MRCECAAVEVGVVRLAAALHILGAGGRTAL
jgi:hypothetical protein